MSAENGELFGIQKQTYNFIPLYAHYFDSVHSWTYKNNQTTRKVKDTMTKKDYAKIAEVFYHQLLQCLGDDKYNERMMLFATIRNMANMLHNDNSRFSYERFYTACGMPEE